MEAICLGFSGPDRIRIGNSQSDDSLRICLQATTSITIMCCAETFYAIVQVWLEPRDRDSLCGREDGVFNHSIVQHQ